MLNIKGAGVGISQAVHIPDKYSMSKETKVRYSSVAMVLLDHKAVAGSGQ